MLVAIPAATHPVNPGLGLAAMYTGYILRWLCYTEILATSQQTYISLQNKQCRKKTRTAINVMFYNRHTMSPPKKTHTHLIHTVALLLQRDHAMLCVCQ